MASDVQAMARQALDEIGSVFARLDPEAAERLCTEVLAARRIVCCGCGRELLMMRAFCMRLMHLGLDAHVAGDVTTPPVGEGDLLLAASGPGELVTIQTLLGLAHEAGARTLVVTAQPASSAARTADVVVHLPAQTMADDLAGPSSLLPMGTAFEISQLVFFDLVSLLLRERTGQTPEEMRARHTNLE